MFLVKNRIASRCCGTIAERDTFSARRTLEVIPLIEITGARKRITKPIPGLFAQLDGFRGDYDNFIGSHFSALDWVLYVRLYSQQ